MYRYLFFLTIFFPFIFSCSSHENTKVKQDSSSADTVNYLDIPQEAGGDTVTRPINNFNWLNFKYDEARIYLYGLNPKSGEYLKNPSIIVDGRLNETVINPDGVVLNENQIAHVNDILSGKFYSEEDNLAAACYLPHHGIVFYKSQKPVSYLSICLMCNQMRAFPNKGYFDANEFRKIIKEVKLPTFKNPMDATEYYKNTKEIKSNKCNCSLEKEPVITYELKNTKLLVCVNEGEQLKKGKYKVSELEVFDCDSLNPILFEYPYGQAILEYDNKSMQLLHQLFVPVDTTWKVKTLPFYKETLIFENETYSIREELFYKPFKLSEPTMRLIKSDYSKLINKLNYGSPENLIWKLFIASINKPSEFESIFLNLKGNKAFPMDGAISEQYSEAIGYYQIYRHLEKQQVLK